jgi:hypothetical protein
MAGEHGHPLLLGATAGESLGKHLKLGVETWKPCGNHVESDVQGKINYAYGHFQ